MAEAKEKEKNKEEKRHKRSNGEGTAPQPHSSGGWRCSIMHHGKRVDFYGSSQKICSNKRKEFIQKNIVRSTMTVEQWVNHYFDTVGSIDLEDTTKANYKTLIKTHIIPSIGDIPLQKLTSNDIQTKLINPRIGNKAPSTLRSIMNIVKKALAHACKPSEKLLSYSPALDVKLPTVPKSKKTALTKEQAAKLLDQAKKSIYYFVLLLLLNTGLRRGEALGLRWQDVDLNKRVIFIRRQVVLINGKPEIVEHTKTKHDREVPLNNLAYKLLSALKPLQKGELVFLNSKDKLVHPRILQRAFDKWAADAGIPDFTLHGMRHTYLTQLSDNGADIALIAEIAGHTKIQTTKDYVHPSMESKRHYVNLTQNLPESMVAATSIPPQNPPHKMLRKFSFLPKKNK